MRLIRWVEGRISGRKSRLKDGSTTSADDQFVYHPSPFRQNLSHIATPAHNPPPKLHHQLEQRLNEQINERLSGHFINDQIDLNSKTKKQLSNSQLRRTTSALESRSKPRKLINRAADYNAIERRRTQYDQQYAPQFDLQYDQQFISQQCDPYSLPSDINDCDPRYGRQQVAYQGHEYQNQYLTEFNNEIQPQHQNRHSSFTQASNESAFFDCSSPSLAQDCNTPSLGKQRSRIKTNPWLPSPWMSSNSITNSLNSNRNNDQNRFRNQFDYGLDDVSSNSSQKPANGEQLYSYENVTNYPIVPTASVRASFSFASTSSSDSGCNVNTNSMEASVLSANNFMNESLMSCSLMTNTSLVDDDEEILTISHNKGGEQVVNQINLRHYMQQINSQGKLFKDAVCNNSHIPQSSTMEDFGEMSSRAESQLSAIYQQIDELKSKIDEIDLDNGRIEAKMNSLVEDNSTKVNLSVKKNASFNSRSSHYPFYDSLNSNHFVAPVKTNSSEEEIITSSSSYSPVSSSSSLVSSPTSIQNSSTFATMNHSLAKELTNMNRAKRSNPQLPNNQISLVSFNSTTTPSSCRSSTSLASSQNGPCPSQPTKVDRHILNASTIDEQQILADQESNSSDNEQLERVINYLKQADPSRLYTQFKYRNGASIQKLLLDSDRRKSLNTKFVNARRSFGQNSTNSNRLSNGSCNEGWVSTKTDLLVSSDDDETVHYVDYVNNKSNNYESKNSKSPENQRSSDLKFNSKKLSFSNSEPSNVDTEQMLSPCYTSYNTDRDASCRYSVYDDRKFCQRANQDKLQIRKPLTPIKVNENYKRLKPINGSKIPVMRPIIETEFDSPSRDLIIQPPSPAPLDRQVNRIDLPRNRNLPKPKAFLFNNKKANYNDSCMVSPLTQQLKFEKERKLNYSFKKPSINEKTNDHKQSIYSHEPLSPLISSDSGLSEYTHSEESHSDNSPLVEQSKNQKLAYQIQNLRLELRDVVKVAINEAKKEDLFQTNRSHV